MVTLSVLIAKISAFFAKETDEAVSNFKNNFAFMAYVFASAFIALILLLIFKPR